MCARLWEQACRQRSTERGTDWLQPTTPLFLCPREDPRPLLWGAHTHPPPTNNVRIRRKRLSDVQTHRRFKCRLFSTVSLSSQSGYSRRSKARIPGVRCGNVPRNMPTRKLLRVLLDFVSGHIHGEFSDRRGRVQLSWSEDRFPAAAGRTAAPRPGDTWHRWASGFGTSKRGALWLTRCANIRDLRRQVTFISHYNYLV